MVKTAQMLFSLTNLSLAVMQTVNVCGQLSGSMSGVFMSETHKLAVHMNESKNFQLTRSTKFCHDEIFVKETG